MSLIDYKNVDIYQGEKLVLQDVNFHVDEGEFMYIIGSVGSGKSSLLKTFYCELDIWHEENKEEEKAEVLERDIFNLKRKEVPALRREMGIIFQDFKLLHEMTVRKNLQFVLTSSPTNSQAVNSNAWPLHVPSSTNPKSLSPTSPPETSTPTPPARLSACSKTSAPRARP